MSTHQTEDGRWYVKFWEDGRSHKKYFGRGDQAKIDAEDYDADIKRIKRRGGKIIEEPKTEKLHFDQLAQRYLDDKRSSGWTDQMTRNLKNLMNRYVIPCIGHKLCEDLTMADSLELRAHITKNAVKIPISPHTINRYVAMTRAVLGWGANNDLIAFNPWSKLRTPRERPDPPELLTLEELRRVMKNAEPHCQWALDVAFNTGCRPGQTELFKLKFPDVDWEGGKILIRGTKTGPRLVNLRRDFLQRLKVKQKEATSDYVIEYDGAPIKQLRRSLGTALTKAGIKKKVRPYDIRHMYGTYMAKNGADIFAIKRLMGHSSITTTERYLHHAEQLQKEAIAKLPSLVKGGGKSRLVPKNGPQPSRRRQPNQPTI